MTARPPLLLATSALLAACGASHAASDAGAPSDAGALPDAAPFDAAPFDAAPPDAGECGDPPPGPTRPAAWACSPCRPPGPGGLSRGECSADADCTDGDNGRCQPSRIGGTCSYDRCFRDEDCAPGELCACDGGSGGGNVCIEAECRTDAECGGYGCAPSLGDCGHYFPPVGYYCHGPADECQSDAECGGGYCAHDPASGRWICSMAECAG